NPKGGAGLGTPNQAVLTILDDDSAEICDNGIDDDGNGLVDCNDPTCTASPVCALEVNGGGCRIGRGSDFGGNVAALLIPFIAATFMALTRKRFDKKA